MTMTSTMMLNRAHDGSVNDEHDDSVDPAAKATRRRFTREFKRRIVDEYDAADRRGTRRGVAPGRSHTSHISKWRHQHASKQGTALQPDVTNQPDTMSPTNRTRCRPGTGTRPKSVVHLPELHCPL
jgi:transposase-like protein